MERVILRKEFRSLIEKKFGEEIKYQYQCMALEHSIFSTTGDHLGLSTLKRLLGFVKYDNFPSKSTLDILARYIGYENYADFEAENVPTQLTSEFVSVDAVEVGKLNVGDRLKLKYQPNRCLSLKYLGEEVFKVEEINGGKLRIGDLLTVRQIAQGFELLATEVVRDGEKLGSYVAARQGGVQKIYRG